MVVHDIGSHVCTPPPSSPTLSQLKIVSLSEVMTGIIGEEQPSII